ncbi:MAG TPA: hypothetical protein VN759_07000 [Pseudolysinimonas sp.]|nr:hypothetical protein [Pseudolysinimonas sp.]
MTAPRRPALLWLLIAILTAEFLAVAALAVVSIVLLVTGSAGDFASGIALTIVIVLAALGLGATVVGAVRGRSWIRAASIVWQVLQVAVGIGALQGAVAQPVYGWPLIIVAVVAFILLFTRPVVAATSHRSEDAL